MVGENVRRYRVAADLSQEELAARMGVDQGYVSSLEAGRRNPTIVTMWHAAVALGVQPAMLFEPVDLPVRHKSRRSASTTKPRRRKR